ncbi:MAG: PGPGW domain-containing protein [Solirubrobacteraceae bacterium]|nr:PGPGW domain-containing protein [Solirubrobacteraceae bacterium]
MHRARPRVIRVLYAAVGVTVLLAGLIMLVTPGPAFAIIPIGLFILALEFTWAEAALEKSLEQADKAKQKAAQTTRTQRVLTATAVVLAVAAVVAWALMGDIPVVPV